MKGVPAEVTARPAPTPAPRRSAVRRALAWAIVSVLAPSRAAMRGISLAGVISIAGSIATGAAVRLSQSGLGCTTWPNCTGQSLVAASSRHSSLMHAWVEFGNRLFVTLVMIVSVVVLVAAWRYRGDELGAGPARRWPPRRRLLIGLAAVQPAGVVAQAVLGGIVVLTDLNPVTVSIHFLATMAILAAAVALYDMFAVGAQPGAAVAVGRAAGRDQPDGRGRHGGDRHRPAGRCRRRAQVPAAHRRGDTVPRRHRLAARRPHRGHGGRPAVRGRAALRRPARLDPARP